MGIWIDCVCGFRAHDARLQKRAEERRKKMERGSRLESDKSDYNDSKQMKAESENEKDGAEGQSKAK